MKALEILENLKEHIETESRVGDLDYSHYSVIIDYVDESIEELEELENRSCSNCFFNSSKDKKSELITCDKCLGFINQRIFKYCGSWKLKDYS